MIQIIGWRWRGYISWNSENNDEWNLFYLAVVIKYIFQGIKLYIVFLYASIKPFIMPLKEWALNAIPHTIEDMTG